MATLDPIYIPQITSRPNRTETIEVHHSIPGFESLTPVKGELSVTHSGNYLEISASLETIITLACHRCLQQYNHKLAIAPSEYIWLREAHEDVAEFLLDQDLDPDELVESLPPSGNFDPAQWLYEQLCLEIPRRQLCDPNCGGIQLENSSSSRESQVVDARWASLASLRQQMGNSET